MKKVDYVNLVTELHKFTGADPKTKVDDRVNSFVLGGHSIALVFDESIPDVVFIMVDCGGSALVDHDRTLLAQNAELAGHEAGYGCWARWPGTDSIVYRAIWIPPATAKTEPELAHALSGAITTVASQAIAGLAEVVH